MLVLKMMLKASPENKESDPVQVQIQSEGVQVQWWSNPRKMPTGIFFDG